MDVRCYGKVGLFEIKWIDVIFGIYNLEKFLNLFIIIDFFESFQSFNIEFKEINGIYDESNVFELKVFEFIFLKNLKR